MPRATAGKGRTAAQRLRSAIAPGAGRRRLRRGDQQPVRLGGRLRPAAAAGRRSAAAGGAAGEPDQGRGAAAAHHAAARPVPGGRPQHRARLRRSGAVRDRERGQVQGVRRRGHGRARRSRSRRSCRSTAGRRLRRSPSSRPRCPISRGTSACVLTGEREAAGLVGRGPARPASTTRSRPRTRAADQPGALRGPGRPGEPWHPGRCAEFVLEPAGSERRAASRCWSATPASCIRGSSAAFRLPPRTCAVELDLSLIEAAAAGLPPVQAPVISGLPGRQPRTSRWSSTRRFRRPTSRRRWSPAPRRRAGGSLLEEVRLFDVYTGEQVGEGRKSLAYALRFRAPDRTLTDEEVAVARDAAVAEAGRRTGAVLPAASVLSRPAAAAAVGRPLPVRMRLPGMAGRAAHDGLTARSADRAGSRGSRRRPGRTWRPCRCAGRSAWRSPGRSSP